MTTSGRPGARKLSVAARKEALIARYFDLPPMAKRAAWEALSGEERLILRQAGESGNESAPGGQSRGAVTQTTENRKG